MIHGGFVHSLTQLFNPRLRAVSVLHRALCIVSISLCMAVFAPRAANAQDVKAACAKVDDLLEEGKVPEARKALDEAFALGQKDYEWLWRASRVYVLQGDMQSSDKEKFYYEARRLADEAVKLNGNGMMGYVRRAAASGKVGLFKGVLAVADLVKSVREDCDKAIKLNNTTPTNLGTAHYILGRTHLKLSETAKAKRMLMGLGWGNLDEALANLKRSTELRSDFVMFHLDYARALAANSQYNEARGALQKISSIKNQEYGDADRRKEADALAKEIAAK
jgi:tetratricopeptide (TPR) repeat protein